MGLWGVATRLATALLIAWATATLVACSSPVPALPAAHAAGGDCTSSPPVSPLPTWARAGFTPPAVPMPHVLGARGDIVAILWAPKNPLWAPPRRDPRNKILWVPRVEGRVAAPMRIFAMLAGTVRTASLTVPNGPGPSLINMPAPGCWIMHVTWDGITDVVRLRYAAGTSRRLGQT